MYVLVRSSKRGTAQARAMHAAGTLAILAPCQMPGTERESLWLSREQLDGRTMRMALCIRYVSPVRSRAIGQQGGGGQPCPFFFCLFYFIGFSRQDRFGHTSIGVCEGLGCGRLGQSGRWDTGGVLDVAGLGA